jgi:hypothetical protein
MIRGKCRAFWAQLIKAHAMSRPSWQSKSMLSTLARPWQRNAGRAPHSCCIQSAWYNQPQPQRFVRNGIPTLTSLQHQTPLARNCFLSHADRTMLPEPRLENREKWWWHEPAMERAVRSHRQWLERSGVSLTNSSRCRESAVEEVPLNMAARTT